MLYRRGRYFWLKFKWRGRTIRISTRAEDVKTAQRTEKIIRRGFALSYARQLKFKGDPRALSAFLADLTPLRRQRRKDPAKRFPSKFRRDQDDNFLRALGIANE